MRHILVTLAFLVPVGGIVPLAQPNVVRDRAMVLYRLGLEEMQSEAFDKAERAFQAAVEVDPEFEMGYYLLGRAQLAQKKFRDAVVSFSKTRDLYMAAAGTKFSSAQDAQRYRRDRILEIDEVIRQLQSAAPTQQTLRQLRQLAEQKRLLEEAIRRGDDISIASRVPAYVSLSLGSAWFRSGNLAEAETYYKEAIATDSGAGEAHNNLAVVYLETGRLDDAQRSVDAAEKAGFRVHPDLKAEIRKRARASRTPDAHPNRCEGQYGAASGSGEMPSKSCSWRGSPGPPSSSVTL